MAEITAKMVMELRGKTGAGMADCKKALTETDGDMEQAIDYLRKKGAAQIAKRADRESNEGVVLIRVSADSKTAVLLAVTCETDFVSRNQEFVDYATSVVEAAAASTASTKEELLALKVGDVTVEAAHNDILAKFSEKIEIGRFERITTTGSLTAYIHNGSKLGVVLDLSAELTTDTQKAYAKDIAMQIAAMAPAFVNRSAVTQDALDREKAIYLEQAAAEGKAPDMAERIATGKIEKYYKEACLIEQPFVKDATKTVTDIVKEIAADAVVNNFVRVAIG